MNGYKDDEFCQFCGNDLIYLNNYGWLCPNHNSTVIFIHTKATRSYSMQIRIAKNGLAVINQSNSFEPNFRKTIYVEFITLSNEHLKYHKSMIEKIVGKEYLDKIFCKNMNYVLNAYNIIYELPDANVKLYPDDFDKNLEKIKKLIPFI